MLKHFFVDKILNNIEFELDELQKDVVEKMTDFCFSPKNETLFILKGYAGTGKTSLVAGVVRTMHELGENTVLLAPTGRAAKVFSAYSSLPAFTIHKKIYRQKEQDLFSLAYNSLSGTLFIVDEASMISNQGGSIFGSGCLLDDLMTYIYGKEGNRLMLVGDGGQLPPVGTASSPALDPDYLREHYGISVYCEELDKVGRQTEDSGILWNATNIRMHMNTFKPLCFRLKGFPDIDSVSGEELLEIIESCYDRYGEEETIVICRSNKRAVRFNAGIRSRIMYREEDIAKGDRVMVVKNNYFWGDGEPGDFIANGEIAVVDRVGRRERQYGLEYAELSLTLDSNGKKFDATAILDTLTSDGPALTGEEGKRLYLEVEKSYADIKSKRRRLEKMREDPYYNALQVKYAYAITCHKAQGGQWDAVFLDAAVIRDDIWDEDFCRWLYTAVTRARKKLYLINLPESYKA